MAIKENSAPITVNNDLESTKPKYKLVAPDGGWGIAVMLAVVQILGMSIVPMCGFGIVYTPFLESIGDVTSGTAIANSVFNTALCFTGLAANQLLQKISYRKVGMIGAFVYFTGSFCILFVTSLFQLVFTFGILQGIGFGLLMPSMLTAFNLYFEKRRTFFMSIAQTCVGIEGILVPVIFQYSMTNYGFRGTVALLSAFTLQAIPGVLSLQPIKWHLKKQKVLYTEQSKEEKMQIEDEPLLEQTVKHNILEKSDLKQPQKFLVNVPTMSASAQNLDKFGNTDSFWATLVKALDLGLFKDPVYINIAIGVALALTSDLMFIAVLPLVLIGNGFKAADVTIIMTTHFVADLVGRICLSILSAAVDVKNRHLFLTGALFSAIFRIAFTWNGGSFWWITSLSAILGFLRCLIQVPLPLVIAEAYQKRFVTAFSLYMVVCGCVALSFGFLAAAIKKYTQSDIMVVHLYTLAFLLCAIPWSIELLYIKCCKKENASPK